MFDHVRLAGLEHLPESARDARVVFGGNEAEELGARAGKELSVDTEYLGGRAREDQRVVARVPFPRRTVPGALGELEPFLVCRQLEFGAEAADGRAEDLCCAAKKGEVLGPPILRVGGSPDAGDGLQSAVGENRQAHGRSQVACAEALAYGVCSFREVVDAWDVNQLAAGESVDKPAQLNQG